MLVKIAKRNISIALKVWAWCLEQFLPYARYDYSSAFDMTTEVINQIYSFPSTFRSRLVRYIDANPDFCRMLMQPVGKVSVNLPSLIVPAIEERFFQTALSLFEGGLKQAAGQGEPIRDIIGGITELCENSDNETAEYFYKHMLPLAKAINIEVVQSAIADSESAITESLCSPRAAYSVPENAEQKNAWRKTVADGKKYGLDPRDFKSELEYLNELSDRSGSWREPYEGQETCGLDPRSFATKKEFLAALDARLSDSSPGQQPEPQGGRQLPAEPAGKGVYTYCAVSLSPSSHPYYYRTCDASIKVGDIVVVPAGDKQATGTVVSVGQYSGAEVPFPPEKTKFIISKADSSKQE